MSKKITRNKTHHGGHPDQESGVAHAVEDITASARKTVSGNRKPLALLLGTVVVVMLAIWIFKESQAAQADQLQQDLYELKKNPPADDQVVTWIGKLDTLLEEAGGQAAEKSTYLEIVNMLIQQADPSSSTASILSGPAVTSKSGPDAEKNRIAMLKAARRIAGKARGKFQNDERVESWNTQIQKLVDGELKPQEWLPESSSNQSPPTEAEKAPK